MGGLLLTCPTSVSSSNKILSSDISVINNIIMIMHPFIHFYLTLYLFAIAMNAGVMEITLQ